MRFSVLTVATFAALPAVFSLPRGGALNALSKRAPTQSEIVGVFNDLTGKFQAGGTALTAALTGVNPADSTAVLNAVTPVLLGFDQDLKEANVALALQQRHRDMTKRQEPYNLTEIAEAIGEVITALIEGLGPLLELIEQFPILGTILGPLLSNLDVDLAIILTGLGILLAGVLALVGDLLANLGAALGGLGFGQVIGLLGL